MKSFGTSIIISTFEPKNLADSFISHFLNIISLKKNSFNNCNSFVWEMSKWIKNFSFKFVILGNSNNLSNRLFFVNFPPIGK